MAKADVDFEIEREGKVIKLPEKLSLRKAIEALERKEKDEEQIYAVHELIMASPYDAAVACVKAMRKLYGWASPETEILKGMFGQKVERPPQMISVPIGHRDEDVVQVPMGAFKLPGVDELVNTTITMDPKNGPIYVIYGKVKKKFKDRVLELANETRRIVKEESIYRGKAIRLPVDSDGDFVAEPPKFLDVSQVDDLIFDDDIMDQINHSILAPIMFTSEVKKNKTPLKRSILLSGPYGTGKSLTARMTARVCEENGWTFVLIDRVQGLRVALQFANHFGRAAVFAEDIDRIASTRDEAANDLINEIDGVLSKRSEVMTILTTNFPERIDPAMIRPGRLDAVISLRPPAYAAVERLIRVYAGKLLSKEEDIKESATALSGQIPATIREAVERAKLGMVWRRGDKLTDGDLVVAARTMGTQLALLNKEAKETTPAERLADSLKKVVGNGSNDMLKTLVRRVDEIHEQVV